MPELLRVRGELRAKCEDVSGADEDFVAAMALADRQSALAWKLRAGISRARLPTGNGAVSSSLSELSRVYARFEEGFDTADLAAARHLLDESGLAARNG